MVLGALHHADRVVDLFFRQTPRRVDKWFRRLQLVSSAAYSLGHGGNDAQKTMGIIWLLLIANGVTTKDHLPTWVVMSCFLAIGLGTMFGGWRIVKTMGQRITKLKPVGGFAAECAGSITLFMATHFGIPVSTTHTITGAIIGVGTTQRHVGRALGRGRQHRDRVDRHHSGVGRHRRARLVARRPDLLAQAPRRVPSGFPLDSGKNAAVNCGGSRCTTHRTRHVRKRHCSLHCFSREWVFSRQHLRWRKPPLPRRSTRRRAIRV